MSRAGEVHVVSSSGANIIVTVLGARFGIDTKVAMHIMTSVSSQHFIKAERGKRI